MTPDAPRDPFDLTGKIAAPAERFDTVVVGAGPAGTAAALAAAAGGRSVLLVDENPVPAAAMGTDVPLFFGGRMTAAAANPARMVETLFLTNPNLEAAFDAGVDVRLGTAAWGLYANGPALRALPEPLLGLADAERTTMVGFGELVLATGARDVVLGFPGWDQPGVMGAAGFHRLLTRYQALSSRRIVVLGSGALALETALLAHTHGIEVAAIVESRQRGRRARRPARADRGGGAGGRHRDDGHPRRGRHRRGRARRPRRSRRGADHRRRHDRPRRRRRTRDRTPRRRRGAPRRAGPAGRRRGAARPRRGLYRGVGGGAGGTARHHRLPVRGRHPRRPASASSRPPISTAPRESPRAA